MSDAVDEQLKRNQKGDYEMKEIIDGRRTGKTTKLIYWLLDAPDNVKMVVADEARRRSILGMLKDANCEEITPDRIVVYNKHLGMGNQDSFIFDDVDWMLRRITQDHPDLYSIILKEAFPFRVKGFSANK